MIKINPFSLAFSKTYRLFHFQTEICFFYIFFHMVNIGPPKKCILPANIFEDFFSFNPLTLYIMKI